MNIETLLTDEEIEAIYVTNLGGTVDDLNIAKAQDAKTKRVIVEWLETLLLKDRYYWHSVQHFLLSDDFKAIKKWALGK